MTISKSQYIKGSQCPKALWFSLNRKDLTPPVDAAKQALFDSGNEIGEWAKKCFPGGIEVTEPYYNARRGAEVTAELIAAGHKVIFEATAIHAVDGTYSRIDILRKAPGTDTWDMIEVKGSTSVKDYHSDDMSFQYRVFKGAGYQINRCFMMLIDNEYVREGEIEPNRLFKLEEITAAVQEQQLDIDAAVSDLKAVLENKEEPHASIGSRCFKPFDCDYVKHCWGAVPDYSIYNVFAGKKADEIVESLGTYEVKGLTADLMPSGAKAKDVSSYISGEVYCEPANIRKFLEELEYPLYYLDYETIGAAIPVFEGTRPFQAIPFQFSLHVQPAPGAELQHHMFLHKEKTDPRKAFVEDLIANCGIKGSIVVYNRAFEKGINTSLQHDFPERAAAIEAINTRMIDLLIPFKNRWLYHPNQHGSASIKSVLPSFTSLKYDGLGITNGQDASQQYLDFMQGKLSQVVIEKLWKDLSEYCGLDTFAMKVLLDVLFARTAVP